VAHRVDTFERVVHGTRVTDVRHAKLEIVRDIGRLAVVHSGAERVKAADLISGPRHGLHHMGSDEPRRSGH
jgi:hypothetical protein